MASVEVLSQSIKDVTNDSRYTARWIGVSTPDTTRLTIHSALTRSNDKVDVYRFRNSRDTETLGFSLTTAKDLHIEIMNNKGRVIADNTATSGDLKDAYDQMTLGKGEADKGYYYVRVSRGKGLAPNEAAEYYFQITNGKKQKIDYDTEETPPPTTSKIAASTQGTLNVASTLQSVVGSSILGDDNFFTQLKSIYSSVVSV